MAERAARIREFAYDASDFERVRALIYDRAGIHLRDNKMEMVYSRLSRRVRRLGLASIGDYLHMLEASEAGGDEWQSFVNALTTNLTAFFRESHHFDRLVEHVRERGRRPLRIWSCAASTGEEPYSIVMTMLEAFGEDWPFDVIATDVDTDALRTAEAGVYSLERVGKLTQPQLKRFFLKGKGANAGKAKVKPEVRDRVRFHPMNLLDREWLVDDGVDIIFCRNVFIYFDTETQGRILEHFRRILARDGLLFAGHSESLLAASNLFRSEGRTVFRPLHQTESTAPNVLTNHRGGSVT